MKKIAILFALATGTALLLSVVWQVPYIYTFIGFASWAFAGHVITIDDDMPGDWSNPDGLQPFPWRELVIKAAVLLVLIAVAVLVPGVRALGGGPT